MEFSEWEGKAEYEYVSSSFCFCISFCCFSIHMSNGFSHLIRLSRKEFRYSSWKQGWWELSEPCGMSSLSLPTPVGGRTLI